MHLHNLHNLGLSLVDETFARGIRTIFSTHNYWLGCARNYLFRDDLSLCDGPGDAGRACATCVGSRDAAGYAERRSELRERFSLRVDRILAVSEAMRRTLLGLGFPAEMLDVVHQAMPEDEAIWDAVGRDRRPGRGGGRLTVGFVGSAYPHKGPQLLVEAAQLVDCDLRVRIHGEVPRTFAEQLSGARPARSRRARRRVLALGAARDPGGPRRGGDPLALVGLCTARRRRVPGRAACRCSPRTWVASPTSSSTAATGCCSTGARHPRSPAALEQLAHEPGLLERLQGGIAAPKPFAAYVDELEAIYAGDRAVRPRTASTPVAVRWVGDQSTASSLSTINREVGERLRVAARRRSRSSGARPTDRSATRRRRTRPRSRCATSGRPTSRVPRRDGSR